MHADPRIIDLLNQVLRKELTSINQYLRILFLDGVRNLSDYDPIRVGRLGPSPIPGAGEGARAARRRRPGDIPTERAERLELVINKAAARRLGVTLPSALLLRADQVIE